MCPCRALLEGWASFMWQRFSGVLIWKTQNPWSGLRGQLYDWLLAPTGGYFGAMLACEPVHVQLNLHSCRVKKRHLLMCFILLSTRIKGCLSCQDMASKLLHLCRRTGVCRLR